MGSESISIFVTFVVWFGIVMSAKAPRLRLEGTIAGSGLGWAVAALATRLGSCICFKYSFSAPFEFSGSRRAAGATGPTAFSLVE